MKTFNMYLDQKVTTWMRTEFNVEAETIEDAKILAEEMFSRGELDEKPWEEIMDSTEVMRPKENDGQATAEIYYWDDVAHGFDEFYSNKIKTNETN